MPAAKGTVESEPRIVSPSHYGLSVMAAPDSSAQRIESAPARHVTARTRDFSPGWKVRRPVALNGTPPANTVLA